VVNHRRKLLLPRLSNLYHTLLLGGGAIVLAAPAVTDALQYCHQAAVVLESLKDREIDREGNLIFLLTRFFLLSSFTDLDSF
jgi:hypothetical protein